MTNNKPVRDSIQQQPTNNNVVVTSINEVANVPAVPKYVIWMRNDDYTPFRLVQNMLNQVFRMNAEAAVAIAHACHSNGQAVIFGPTSRELVETRLEQARAWLRQHEMYGRNGHQLDLRVEESE
jgi:ATP-dependent Clp protease adapter protein ClpS